MAKRVEGKAAIVVGGGQTPGARVLVVDRHKASAQKA
jgi:hypothetical protein